MSISRILSLILAGIYLLVPIVCYFSGDEEALIGFFGVLAFLLLPMACIWYGDELGGLIGIKYGLVSSTSPGWAVQLMGWVFLLMPLIIGIVWVFID
ncbi:MAG: hypothetical protein ACYSSO_11830 [Planctomycetota bacterium]|jgi:hypothetical protein